MATREISKGLPEHEATLEHAKDSGTPGGGDHLTSNDIDDQDVPKWPPDDRNHLRVLEDVDSGSAPRQDTQDLRQHSDGGDEGLECQSQTWADLFDHPASYKEVDRATKDRTHGEDGKVHGGVGCDFIHRTPLIGRALVWRVRVVVVLTFHDIKDIEDAG